MTLKIEDIYTASRVRVFDLPEKIPLEEQDICPSCDNALKAVCVFSNSKNMQKVRFGLCDFCGYSGYMDRPSKEWIADFYSRKWDKKSPRSREDVIKSVALPKQGPKAGRWLTFSLADKVKVDKERLVCEIGCGYGEVLKNFENAGFKNLIGIEHSNHRADFVRKNFGFTVLDGEFENINLQSQLKKLRPIGVFFSHHVLEHTYNPAEIIGLISSLQNNGDYLLLSLPDSAGEHINYALFYLVHLHSFTKESLELLLNKNGYEIVADNSPDNTNIIIAAQKTANPTPRFKLNRDYYHSFMNRIENCFALSEMESNRLYNFHWEQKLDKQDSRSLYKVRPDGFLGKIGWNLKKITALSKARFLHRLFPGYQMLIKPIKQKFTPVKEPPLEIEFKDSIKFLIK